MKLTSVNYSLSSLPATLQEWKANLLSEINGFNSDVILYPELFLLGATKYMDGLKSVSDFVWKDLLPQIDSRGKLIVLGTSPRVDGQSIHNSAPILLDGKIFHQDKLNLTPWEVDFTPGNQIIPFTFQGLTTVVNVCFDIEQLGLAYELKKIGVDLLLVPSATVDRNGSSRVNRCASARAIELGAAVLTSLLIGDSSCDLVDHSEGLHGLYLPAQQSIKGLLEQTSSYSTNETVTGHYEMDAKVIKQLKSPSSETKPFTNIEQNYIVSN